MPVQPPSTPRQVCNESAGTAFRQAKRIHRSTPTCLRHCTGAQQYSTPARSPSTSGRHVSALPSTEESLEKSHLPSVWPPSACFRSRSVMQHQNEPACNVACKNPDPTIDHRRRRARYDRPAKSGSKEQDKKRRYLHISAYITPTMYSILLRYLPACNSTIVITIDKMPANAMPAHALNEQNRPALALDDDHARAAAGFRLPAARRSDATRCTPACGACSLRYRKMRL